MDKLHPSLAVLWLVSDRGRKNRQKNTSYKMFPASTTQDPPNVLVNIWSFVICETYFKQIPDLKIILDFTNLYPFIQSLLEWPFSELFSSDVSLWNQYKYIAFNIFSCRLLTIFYKILIITGKNKWINHRCNIMSKLQNILLTKTSFFISSAGKTESVLEFWSFSSSCFIAY